ncbi:MAG: hypothetical protein M3Z84_01765 [Actinomycetota bacterium]|nr:hypothetical protein [Actinomycetota bacterium]
METPDVRLAKLAARQHSVVTREQSLALEMTLRQLYRRLDDGILASVHQNVYRVVAAPQTWEQSVMAACLASGGVASHRSAAALWALRGIHLAPVEILVPSGRHPRLKGVVIHRSKLWLPAQFTRRGSIPLTKPALTLLHLGAVAPELVAGAAEDALFKRLVTTAGLRRAVEAHGAQGRDGTAVLRHLLLARDPAQAPTESSLEDAIVAVLRRYGLPEPARQYEVAWPGHRRPLRLDTAYPEALVDIEGDGMTWHSGVDDLRRDRERANYLVSRGWVLLRYGWHDVRSRPEGMAAEVRELLVVRRALAG